MSATETQYEPKLKDRVVFRPEYATPKYSGVYIVTDSLQKNIVLTPEGGGRGVRCKPPMVMPAPEAGAGGATAVGIPFLPHIEQGKVVQWTQHPGELFVVLRDGSRPNCYALTKLGGNGGRYWPNVPRQYLAPVTITNIQVSEDSDV